MNEQKKCKRCGSVGPDVRVWALNHYEPANPINRNVHLGVWCDGCARKETRGFDRLCRVDGQVEDGIFRKEKRCQTCGMAEARSPASLQNPVRVFAVQPAEDSGMQVGIWCHNCANKRGRVFWVMGWGGTQVATLMALPPGFSK